MVQKRVNNPKYVAAGAHEYGHAQYARDSRYPRARVIGNALGNFSDVAGIGTGLVTRGRLGRLGSSVASGAVAGATHMPTLIEEFSASNRALKAMKGSGELTPAQYKEARNMLQSAYKTYVKKALSSASTSAALTYGNTSLLSSSLAAGLATRQDAKRINRSLVGDSKDVAAIKRIANKMGAGNTKLIHSNTAAYASPYSHVDKFTSRKAYKKMLQARSKQRISDRTLDSGAVFIPEYEKSAVFIPKSIGTSANSVKGIATKTGTTARHLAEDLVNFGKDGPYEQAARFLGRYAKNPKFRGNVNTYAAGKLNEAAYKAQTSPMLEPIKQMADDAAGILF